MNPKALVCGLVLVQGAPALTGALALFAVSVALVAAGWMAAGRMSAGRMAAGALAAGSQEAAIRRVLWVRRGAARWRGALSVGPVIRGLA